MAWSWFSVCFLALLSSEVVPGEAQTPSWISGNLQGMMFSVMNGGNVHFRSDNPANITGLTVCLRVLTKQQSYGIQLTLENQTDFVRLDGFPNSMHRLYVSGSSVSFDWYFSVASYVERWPWKNRCFTWESSSGMAQLWLDGTMSVRKGVARGQVFSGQVELSLYQFEGQLSDVYVWDRALSVQELFNFLYYNYNFPPSSILNWQWIQYSTSGYTVLEPKLVRPSSVKTHRRKKQKKDQALRRRIF
ncbi:C-reactive protein-like [Astyanax mexicanus]|uniref:C-reactive protein-like n=1 Tax=Astyanax mexicanus TaxID=7994 RepID=A0A8T2LEZ7_ASTMX|nr:C-reactive protein-like [Astyanax mexicanus]